METTISPAKTEVNRTPEKTSCSDRVLPISILPLNFVSRQTKLYFSVYASDGSDLWLDALELALSDLSLCIVNVDGMLA
jgi:hypothetical protein